MIMSPGTQQGPYRNGFVEKRMEKLDWPAQSPDLNPMQHLWDHLESQLRAIAQSVPDLTKMLFWLNGSKSLPQYSNM
uniref:Tc1-like transposase DDE domain-containing protein n=1 Tax=Anguilla anguilla TaxID=7936 RepID=A0A0E9T1G6_ANGAN